MEWWHPLAYGGVAMTNCLFLGSLAYILDDPKDDTASIVLATLAITAAAIAWFFWLIVFPVNLLWGTP